RKWPWVLFILLFLLAAAAAVIYLLWPRQSPTVSLENLQNMTVEEAEEYLMSEDLEAGHISETYDDNFEEGMIIETTPVSGTEVERGGTVDMLVSLGEEPYTMENYVGERYKDAAEELEASGFTNVGEENKYSDELYVIIIDQSLHDGDELLIVVQPVHFSVSM